MDNQEKLPMPSQCIKTGEAIIGAYGEKKGIQFIESNISGLREAHELISKYKTVSIETRLSISIQSDFWNQVLESTKP
jgi:hypothetical protein